MKHLGREELVRIFAGTAFQGEEEYAARHLVGCGPCSALAGEVVAELAARQALAPGKSSMRVLADLLREKEEMFVRSLQAKAWVAAVRALPEAEQARAVRDWKDLRSRSFLEAVIEEATAKAIQDPDSGDQSHTPGALGSLRLVRGRLPRRRREAPRRGPGPTLPARCFPPAMPFVGA